MKQIEFSRINRISKPEVVLLNSLTFLIDIIIRVFVITNIVVRARARTHTYVVNAGLSYNLHAVNENLYVYV